MSAPVRRRRGGLVVAVTGAAGVLGGDVVQGLLGHESVRRVVGLDVADGWTAPRLEWRRVDVRDPLVGRSLDGVDTVVHLAGLHSPAADPAERRAVNVRGSETLFAACAAAGVSHVVVVTSAMVYGAHADNPLPLDETAPLRAARSGGLVGDFVEVERLIEAHRTTSPRVRWCVLRPVTLVGPGADSVLTRHFEAPRLLAVRGGVPSWQFLHLSDLASACVIAATAGLDGSVNVSPAGWLTQAEVESISGLGRLEVPSVLAFATAERLHRAGVTPAPASDLSYLVHPWAVDNTRITSAGWQPRYSHEEALREQMSLAAQHVTVASRRLGRDDATRAAAGATVALLGTAALVRRARRRRR
jgi:nucleoside-diphosphate-sugar epimerase